MSEGALHELPGGGVWMRLADVADSVFKKAQINADERRFVLVTEFTDEPTEVIHRKGRKERKVQQYLRPSYSLQSNAFSVTEFARAHIYRASVFICVHLRLIFSIKRQEALAG